MKKPPKTIKVGPVDYDLVFMDGLTDDEGKALWGHCCHNKLSLVIGKQTEPSFQKIIVLHEILHAVYNLSGLPDPCNEEQLITSISPLLLLLMKDNPKLMEYLCEW